MAAYASPGLHQPPQSDAERQRIRELSRYYCTVYPSAPPAPSLPPPHTETEAPHTSSTQQNSSGLPRSPSISPDITLNALTQLAVYRFGCNRSFVSLIDGQSQHIIAEATASISLRGRGKHLPDDGVYLGVSTLDLVFGVCPDAVKLFTGQPVASLKNTANMTADRTRFIVHDFTLEDHFKDRPYVSGWPYFRFYAEVPVFSPSGYVLGSFCIVDNKPRHEFSDEDVAALQEISDSIAQHLENVRTVHYHRRSDRLVHGLTAFIKSHEYDGSSSTDEQCIAPSPATMSDLFAHREPGRSRSQKDGLGIEGLSLWTETTEGLSPSLSTPPAPSEPTEMTSVSADTSVDTHIRNGGAAEKTDQVEARAEDLARDTVGGRLGEEIHSANALLVSVKESASVSKRISALFSHASSILRSSMDLDGALFLDASRCNSGIVHPFESPEWEPSPKPADLVLPVHPQTDHSGSASKDPPCDALGLALRASQMGDSSTVLPPIVGESLLRHLTTAFPRGEVFDLEEALPYTQDPVQGSQRPRNSFQTSQRSWIDSRALSRQTAARLIRHFPGAKSVIFLPLWDFDKAQWLAASFFWTGDRERALGLEELHYFKVFGDSIASEVARVNWEKQEKAKSDFVSSISHELRSPLHGMLASAELLWSTPLEAEQRDIVKMLETCGLTLLDTMNHLLDFTKINNLTTLKEGSSGLHQKTSATSLESSFDLDALVEDVVNTMYLGKLSTSSAPDDYAAQGKRSATTRRSNLSVVLRTTPGQQANAWKVHSATGAWRRIIMNIVGNALKYTESGFVEVSLSKLQQLTDTGQYVAHLSVTDSGRGMSPDFLRNKLFSPFVQEDDLSEGVGLGLSIVQKLVNLLKGTVDLKSEKGVGTQVDIFIPVQRASLVDETPEPVAPPQASPPAKFCLVGFDAYDVAEIPTGTLSAEAKRRLCIRSFFAQLVTSVPSWSVSFADRLDNASGDIAIVEESMLKQVAGNELPGANATVRFPRFAILNDELSSATVDGLANRAHVVCVNQPFCPRKVLGALRKISESNGSPQKRLSICHPDLTEPTQERSDMQPVLNCNRTGSPTHNRSRRRKKALIIDDNAINLKVLSTFMQRLGWKYETASNGLIAVNKVKEAPATFDVLLMDMSMPVMDGIDATKHIRAFEQENALSPAVIFAVTGVGSTAMQQKAMTAGVDSYLIKPLSLQKLESVMKDI